MEETEQATEQDSDMTVMLALPSCDSWYLPASLTNLEGIRLFCDLTSLVDLRIVIDFSVQVFICC